MEQRKFTSKPLPWSLEATVEASATRRTVKERDFRPAHVWLGQRQVLTTVLRCAFRDDAALDAPLSVPVQVTVERGRIVIERKETA